MNEQRFILTCEIQGKAQDSAILKIIYKDFRNQRLSQPIIANKAIFQGLIECPVDARLTMKDAGDSENQTNTGYLYLEAGSLKLTAQADDLNNAMVTGSKTQDGLNEIKKLLKPIRAKLDSLHQLTGTAQGAHADSLNNSILQYKAELLKIDDTFIKSFPGSFVSIFALYTLRYYAYPTQMILKYFNGLSDSVKNSINARFFLKTIKEQENPSSPSKIGTLAPLFTSIDVNNHPISLTDFRGKYVLLDFWASWCIPCRNYTPLINALYHKYHAKGLEIIGIASNDGEESEWKKAIQQDGTADWHHILSGYIKDMTINPKDISEKFNIHWLPTWVLIDPHGKIIGFYDSVEPVEKDLTNILN